jgi:hypothetical protein
MLKGFFGFGENYFLFSGEVLLGGLAAFLGGVAYAGSGGNLLLANSFYVQESRKDKIIKENKKDQLKKVKKENLLFF